MIQIFANTFVYHWGSTIEERNLKYPCDKLVPQPDDVLFRAVTVDASASVLFRWLCQMSVAPYSYDWLDNGGKQSPRHLIDGLEKLQKGKRFMQIFTLTDFKKDTHITLTMTKPSAIRLFGNVAVSYSIIPISDKRVSAKTKKTPPKRTSLKKDAGTSVSQDEQCRFVAKFLVKRPSGLAGLFCPLLPIGDWIVARKQLLTLKELAEKSGHTPET